MKFAKLFQQVLEEEAVPDEWVAKAVQYKALKKRINKVVYEMEEIGVEKEDMSLNYDITKIKDEIHPVVNMRVSPLMESIIIEKLNSLKYDYEIGLLDGSVKQEGEDNKIIEVTTSSNGSVISAVNPFDEKPYYKITIHLHEDSKFFQTLYKELEGLSEFKDEMEKEIISSVENLATLIARVGSPNSRRTDMYAWREIFQIYIDQQIFFSTHERSAGERKVEQSREKYQKFLTNVETSKALKRFKQKDSLNVFNDFRNLNEELLKISTFQIMNSMAVVKILKKFDKRTHLHSKEIFPEMIEKSQEINILKGSVAMDMCSIIAKRLLSIIPQLEDYTCPICCSVAFKPIRLDCGHLFCVRCLVKLQRKDEDRCPLCRQDVLLRADEHNLDQAQMAYLKLYFPKEVKQKQAENEKEIFKEQYGSVVDPDKPCIIM